MTSDACSEAFEAALTPFVVEACAFASMTVIQGGHVIGRLHSVAKLLIT
jgi:hypothetical protein